MSMIPQNLKEPDQEMHHTSVDSAIEQLSRLLNRPHLTLPMKQDIHTLLLDLRFLKMFFSCLANCSSTDKEPTMHHLRSSLLMNAEALKEETGQSLYDAGYFAAIGIDVKDWNLAVSKLKERVEHLKPDIRRTCILFLDCSIESKFSMSDGILEFMDSILMNLNDLIKSHAEMAVPVKVQIEALQEKLRFSRNFHDFIKKRCHGVDKLKDFSAIVRDWVKGAVGLSLLYWMDSVDGNMVPQMNTILYDVLQKIMPYTPKVTEMYLGLLKACKSSESDKLVIGEIAVIFLNFLLENVVVSVKSHIEVLRDGLLLLLTFIMDPPKKFGRKWRTVNLNQIYAVIREVTSFICSLCIDKLNEDISWERNILLDDLFEKVKEVEAKVNKVEVEIRELYDKKPNPWQFNFPMTNGIGFFDFFLGNLNKMLKCKGNFLPFAKHKFVTVHQELLFLRPFLEDNMELQNESVVIKDLWTRIINVAYQAEYVIHSCSTTDFPIWSNIICLSDVIHETKLIQAEVTKIKEKQILGNRKLSIEKSYSFQRSHASNSSTDEVVGLTEDAKAVLSRLTRGSLMLNIVSIAGMPGVGKTTLAMKVYTDPSVKSHFIKRAWCYVTQVYRRRDLLIEILRSVVAVDHIEMSKKDDDEIANQLRKSLKRQKYLIVMDDIWNTEAWDAVKESFPDDRNGSRILFTSRNHNLAEMCKPQSHTHALPELTDDKSWELLEKKVFHNDGCPPKFSDVGKKIARNCKGLPLVIAVIAGLLERNKNNIHWWKQIEKSLNSRITTEGCMDILELSYNYLPDSLKACFLYFAAFRQGEAISVRKLTLLWIAEGFLQPETRSLEVVAKESLAELIVRSLVIVTTRSSKGGIKACRVHDLLHYFCMEKAKEERFLHVADRTQVSHYSSNPKKYDQYRLCLYSGWETLMKSIPSCPSTSSLLLFADAKNSNSNSVASQIFQSLKLLKVLNLESINLDCPFPEEIVLIVHLRYLAIRGNITTVPSSISNLWNLETFILKSSYDLVHLPDTVWKMKNLKHIDVSEGVTICLADTDLEESSQLNNVETFSSLSLDHRADSQMLLRRFPKLRKLRYIFLESEDYTRKGIQFPSLTFLKDLESLKVSTYGSGQVFYSWMRIQFQGFNLPSTLKKLTLHKLGLPWRAISELGLLSNLEVLKLREHAFRGKRWNVEEEQFLNLKFLELSNLDIEEWNVSTDSFTLLQHLVLGDCSMLKEIPAIFGEICTLKVIHLRRYSSDVKSSAVQILEEQRDMGNEELELLTTY